MNFQAKKHTVCDSFTVITRGDRAEKMGAITFRFTNRITNRTAYAQIDVPAEVLSLAISPVREAILINMLALKGFRVSPLPESLKTFLHILMFTNDAISHSPITKTESLPDSVKVEIISSRGVVEAGNEEIK